MKQIRIWSAVIVGDGIACRSSVRCVRRTIRRGQITVIVPFPPGGRATWWRASSPTRWRRPRANHCHRECRRRRRHGWRRARRRPPHPTAIPCSQPPWARMWRRPVLTPNVKYDPARRLLPIGITAHSPAVVIARKDFPAKDLKEFVAVLRQQGGADETGTRRHRRVLPHGLPAVHRGVGAKPTLVAYRGSGPALNDLVGGHVDFLCEQSVSVAETALAGSVKAYAVSAAERLASLPNVPAAKEAGVNYEMSVWAGLFAPKGVPSEVIAKLADALDKALDEPAVRERLASSAARYRPRPSATRQPSTVLFAPRWRAGRQGFLAPPRAGRNSAGQCLAARSSCGSRDQSPLPPPILLMAMTACVRLSTPSFCRMAETCALMVASETPSLKAICLLSRPSPSIISTRTCWGVSVDSRETSSVLSPLGGAAEVDVGRQPHLAAHDLADASRMRSTGCDSV